MPPTRFAHSLERFGGLLVEELMAGRTAVIRDVREDSRTNDARSLATWAGGEAVLRVRDDGTGIPREMLVRIFEPFTQLDRSLERSAGGLGIGLALVRRLVELHGGSVEAHSEGVGRGSEFVVRLPALAQPAPASAPQRAAQAGASPALRILVVDDNADSADSLAALLRLLGHEIRTEYDGLAAVDGADAFRPDVVFLDIGLPGLDGYQAAREIAKRRGEGEVTLVALTGWGQDEDRRRSQEAGFAHHLVKPAGLSALRELLGTVSAQHAAAGASAAREQGR